MAHFSIVLICLALVFATGLNQLKSEPARPADINSIKALYVSRSHPDYSINDVVRFVALQDPSHLPLYHITLSLWSRYAGRDLFTIRLLSLFTGLLAVAFTYRLARETGGKDVAMDAVLITSFLTFFIFYTHQARMYALLALASAWVVWSYWKLLITAGKLKRHLCFSLLVSCASIIYTHYFGFFLLAAIGIYHLLFAAKNKRWLKICLLIACAGMFFLPWLPYTLSIFQIRNVPASNALTLGESLQALLSIYTNGMPVVAPLIAVVILLRFRQLSRSQLYILFVVASFLSLLLIANEFTSLIISRRIRYTVAIAAIWACALAIGLNSLPNWPLLRWPAFAIWIVSFFVYWNSDTHLLYTNQLNQKHRTVPHFQDLLYEPSIVPRQSDFVVSFHRDTPLNDKKLLDYYGRKTGGWRGLIHIWNDADGNPSVQSTDTRYQDVQSMAIWNFPIWLIYNPQETDLQSMAVFSNSFSSQFHSCGRFLETDDSIVELYVKRPIPCDLLISEQLLEVHYENGTELANIEIQLVDDLLNVYLWWTNTIANQYSFSLQLFDARGAKVAQLDDVIGGDALLKKSLDVAHLPEAEYAAKFILYDFESHESQPGTIVDGETRFERDVEVARITISS